MDSKRGRGHFGIGIYQPKKDVNIGTLWRTAYNFGASYIFTIGNRYKEQKSDTVKAYKNIPLFYYENFTNFHLSLPRDTKLTAIELNERSRPIKRYCHHERCVYLLGSENLGLPIEVLNQCDDIVQLPGKRCLNVSTSGSIVMFDRINKLI